MAIYRDVRVDIYRSIIDRELLVYMVEEVGPTWFEYIDIQERRDKEFLGRNVIDIDPNDYPERNSKDGFCIRGLFQKKG